MPNDKFFEEYSEAYQNNFEIAEAKEITNISRFLNREYLKGVEEYQRSGKVSGWDAYFKPEDIAVLYSILYMNIGVRFSKLYVKFFGSSYKPIINTQQYAILWRDYFREAGKRIAQFKGAGVSQTQQKELTRVIQRLHRNPEFQIMNEREAGRILRSQVKDLSVTRAKTIVRTEANAAANLASERTAYDMFGKDALKKWWITSGDERVRDAHVFAGIQYSRGKAIEADALFNVGGETMMRPSSGSIAANNINCRCEAIYEPVRN